MNKERPTSAALFFCPRAALSHSDGIVGPEFPGAVVRCPRESGRPSHVGKSLGPVFGTTTTELFGSSRTEQPLGETQLCFISDTSTQESTWLTI